MVSYFVSTRNARREAGICVEFDEGKGFAKAFRQLVCDGELRERLGAKGRSIEESF